MAAVQEFHTRLAHNLEMSRLANNGVFGLEFYLTGRNNIKTKQLLLDGIQFCDELIKELNNENNMG